MSSESLKNSWLGHALLIAIGHAAATQRDAATSSGMSCGALSRYISGQRRAGPDTMRALTMAPIWARPGDAARIMIGHLRDEMQRADMAPEAIAIYPRPAADRAGATRAALRMLADHAADPDLAALLVDLAALVCRGADAEQLPVAAESRAQNDGEKYFTGGLDKPQRVGYNGRRSREIGSLGQLGGTGQERGRP